MARKTASLDSESPKKGAKSSAAWVKEISAAEKDPEFRKFLERGRRVVKRYMGETPDAQDERTDSKFNVFWSNVGVLKAALYANAPKPVVKREFDDYKDQPGRVAAIIMERLLSQPFEEEDSELNTAFKSAVEDYLLPGLGQLWLLYKPEIKDDQVMDEQVEMEYVYWEDFLWSPCRSWKECRWAGRAVYMTKAEFEDKFGEEYTSLVGWATKSSKDGDITPEDTVVKKTKVYEIWHKTKRQVIFISKDCSYELDRVEDPLQLRDFFPFPKPLLATHTTNSMVPKSDYMMVQTQYVRLNDLTVRIQMLEDAIQASGVYDKTNTELSALLNGSKTNRMIAVDNWAYFAEKGGLKGTIDWFPLQMIVDALDKLRELKNEAKAELFELTGLSDMMRGISSPRETAHAQDLKAQYSSVRLQYKQNEVASFVQEALRIKGEIIATHFDKDIILRNSLIQLTPDAEYAEAAVDILKSDWGRMYRVQIFADTLSIPDYNAERQGRIEFISATGQFVSQVMPLIQAEPGAAPFLMEILQWGIASFRSAQSIEGVFSKALLQLANSAKQPKQQQPDPAALKAQADIAATQARTEAYIADLSKKTDAKMISDKMQTESEAAQSVIIAQGHADAAVAKAEVAAQEHLNNMQQAAEQHDAEMQQAAEQHAEEMRALRDSNEAEIVERMEKVRTAEAVRKAKEQSDDEA